MIGKRGVKVADILVSASITPPIIAARRVVAESERVGLQYLHRNFQRLREPQFRSVEVAVAVGHKDAARLRGAQRTPIRTFRNPQRICPAAFEAKAAGIKTITSGSACRKSSHPQSRACARRRHLKHPALTRVIPIPVPNSSPPWADRSIRCKRPS